VSRSDKDPGEGVLSRKEAVAWRKVARREGKKVVFTNGCFDLLHRGHVELLKEAARLGDCLIVGLNSDRSVRRLKGKGRPFMKAEDRTEILASMRWVDAVVIFDEDTPYRLIEELLPDVLIKGGDYSADEIVGGEVVGTNGGEVMVIPYLEGYSTTALVRSIRRGITGPAKKKR